MRRPWRSNGRHHPLTRRRGTVRFAAEPDGAPLVGLLPAERRRPRQSPPLVDSIRYGTDSDLGRRFRTIDEGQRWRGRPGGDRATVGRGTARDHACRHGPSRPPGHTVDRGRRRCAVATSVRSGGRGGPASQEATTCANARSRRSGSASTTSRNARRADRSEPAVAVTGHTATGWRSSAVVGIAPASPTVATAGCSSVATVIFRGLARSATGMVSRSTPPV